MSRRQWTAADEAQLQTAEDVRSLRAVAMAWLRANSKKSARVEIPDGIRYAPPERPADEPKQRLTREGIRATLMGA